MIPIFLNNFVNDMRRSKEEMKEFLWYEYQVRKLSECNYRKDYLENKQLRGKGFVLDHRVSIVECFDKDMPIEHAGHICNLKVIPLRENQLKGKDSELTSSELLEEIVQYESDADLWD